MTLRFIRDSRKDDRLVITTLLRSTPFPGTELRRMCEGKNLISASHTWDDYNLNTCVAQMGEVSGPELERIASEMSDEFSRNVPIELFGFIGRKLRHPMAALKNIRRDYKRIPDILRRLTL